MDLLHYEFIDGPDGSINGMLRKLVKDLRYNRSEIPIEQFKQTMPALRAIESRLQSLDADMGESKRNYIDEILKELDEESQTDDKLFDDLNRAPYLVSKDILGIDISLEDLAYHIGKSSEYKWLQFLGYADQRTLDANLLIVREVFRSLCNKHNYIFIDLS